VKDLRFDRSDALSAPIELRESGTVPSIDVVLSPNVAQLEGVVTDEKSQPMAGVQAVLVPDRGRTVPNSSRPASPIRPAASQ